MRIIVKLVNGGAMPLSSWSCPVVLGGVTPSAIPKVSRCDCGGKTYVISGVMPLENVQVEIDGVVMTGAARASSTARWGATIDVALASYMASFHG